jgi:hypothetical protein
MLILIKNLQYSRKNPALTGGTSLVNTNILIRVELTIHSEDAHRSSRDLHHESASFGDISAVGNKVTLFFNCQATHWSLLLVESRTRQPRILDATRTIPPLVTQSELALRQELDASVAAGKVSAETATQILAAPLLCHYYIDAKGGDMS